MCDLDPSRLNSEVGDLEQRIRDNLSPGLQYACAHVSAHVSQTPAESVEACDLVEEFGEVRLMNWLEALSLMGRVPEAVGMASLIESWLKINLHPHALASSNGASLSRSPNSLSGPPTIPTHSSNTTPTSERSAVPGKRAKVKHFLRGILPGTSASTPIAHTPFRAPAPAEITTGKPRVYSAEIFHDLQRFIMTFIEPIIGSSLHIYSSALLLTPSETELSRRYGKSSEGGIRVVRGRPEHRSRSLWTATKHSGPVSCLAMSPDGMTIVSGSYDHTVRLWDAQTGAAIGKAMEGHTGPISCVEICLDGTTIVSGSWDNTLQLWDAKTGAAVGMVMDHTSPVNCIAVSPDGMTIVSGSYDDTLHPWVLRGIADLITRVTVW
ncbi:hypothetical protein FRB94_000572 [Tulasnella sp. JGI-2019a]|nr:hypothetical protein FRB94_000572 [Tulasnella sp. JGI-2019a]